MIWRTIIVGGVGAFAVRTVTFAIRAPRWDAPCLSGGIVCGGSQPGWYRSSDMYGSDGD